MENNGVVRGWKENVKLEKEKERVTGNNGVVRGWKENVKLKKGKEKERERERRGIMVWSGGGKKI